MTPSVSIVTPTYNRARLLPRAWASLIGQSEQGFEWIVVDDGSTDNTRDVVEGFNDPRIRYVWQENQGVNGARNRGDREVRAEYIIYLDSDDELLHATILAEMLAEIRATPAEVAWVSFTVVDGERNPGLSHVPADRLETGYLDHVCEQTIWGSFSRSTVGTPRGSRLGPGTTAWRRCGIGRFSDIDRRC